MPHAIDILRIYIFNEYVKCQNTIVLLLFKMINVIIFKRRILIFIRMWQLLFERGFHEECIRVQGNYATSVIMSM